MYLDGELLVSVFGFHNRSPKPPKPVNYKQSGVSAESVLEMHENDTEFHRKIISTNETHFHLGYYDDKQNREELLLSHPQSVTLLFEKEKNNAIAILRKKISNRVAH